MILDAGFTSTKLNIYTFSDMIIVSSYTKFYHPGMHELELHEIKEMIERMLDDAHKFVVENGGDVCSTRIALVATEGLRSLEKGNVDEILRCIRTLIGRSRFVGGRNSVSVMDGVFEGLYAYEALVYLLFLRDNKNVLQRQMVSRYDIGSYDMGGGINDGMKGNKEYNADGNVLMNSSVKSTIIETGNSNKSRKDRTTAGMELNEKNGTQEVKNIKMSDKITRGQHSFKGTNERKVLTNEAGGLKSTEESEFDTITYLKTQGNQENLEKVRNDKQIEQHAILHKHIAANKLSLGIIEMGGGSMQIAFSTNINNKYQLFIHSFHDLGLIKGRNKLHSLNILDHCKDLNEKCVRYFRTHFNLHEFSRIAPLDSVHKFYLLSFFYDRLSEYRPIHKFSDIINIYRTHCTERSKNCDDLEYMILVLKGIGLKNGAIVEIGRMIDDKNLSWGLAKALEMLIG